MAASVAADKSGGGGLLRPRVCFFAMISTAFWSLIFYAHHTGIQGGGNTAMASVFLRPSAFSRPLLTSFRIVGGGEGRCAGRRVYMYDLPARFNADLVRDCALYSRSMDVCRLAVNDGFGPSLPGGGAMPDRDVYDTDQYMLALIYHARMRRYECLAADASDADAVFVPFYAGFDAAMNLWKPDLAARDALPHQLVEWLARRPEWRAMGGRDHFLVAARPVWDFYRGGDNDGWGNALLTYPAIRNTTVLTVEANPWKGIDFGVPFPSHFHPTSDADMLKWQERMRRRDRRCLWAFAGAPRPGSAKTVRAEIISQCSASSSCTHFGSSPGHYNSPDRIMELLESATFCIQPRGDSFTRKSTFDSMLAGCIPVFLHPASAYTQYTWHLPRDYHTYSVFIPHTDVAGDGKNASIEERLRSIPAATVATMREEVIRLIPRITYRDPAATLVTFRDAFDVAVDAVLDRVARRRRADAEGREYVDVFDGHDSWKHDLLEDGQTEIGPHEFDPYL